MSAPRPVVWVPRPVHDDALEKLGTWAEVARGWGEHPAAFDDVADTVTGILLRTERVDGAMLRRAPRLRIVARHGAGVDSVDVDTARELGIRVTTTPGANAPAVAEHTIALLMAARRGIAAAARGASRADLVGRELAGSTLGLIGYGRIAQHVARIATGGFGMRILAHDPFADPETVRESGAEPVSLEELSRRSDAVSVHVPLTTETRGLVSGAFIDRMPAHGIVVNTSRGGIVDEEALLTAVDAGSLGGAGLDVTSVEPLPEGHPLRSHPRVVVTPHIGGQTEESMRRVALMAEASLREELDTRAAS